MQERDVLTALYRQDLGAFIARVFHELNPGTPYLPNWHIEALAYQLMRVARGETRRLAICMPPRHLKSICSSVAFPAWLLGCIPHLKIICASYSNELSFKHGDDTKTIMQSPFYRRLFPDTVLNPRKVSAHEIGTLQKGNRLSTSVGGTLTGLGADIIILDDMMKVGEANSAAVRRTAIEWLNFSLMTRLNNQTTGAIILVMQRLHVDDLVGHLLERGGWEVFSLPLIAEEDGRYRLGSGGIHRRRQGDILHPGLMDAQSIADLRLSQGAAGFSAQYQQRPIPAEGNMIQRQWLQTYHTLPDTFDQIIQSWDLASGVEATNDYSVGTTWGIKDARYFLLDVFRRKLPFPALVRAVIEQRNRFSAHRVLIERAGVGLAMIQQLCAQVRFAISPILPKEDKQTRLEAHSCLIEAGRMLLPDNAPWLGEFLDEILAFPHARHDDQVDSLSQFLKWAFIREQQARPRVRAPGQKLHIPSFPRCDPFAEFGLFRRGF